MTCTILVMFLLFFWIITDQLIGIIQIIETLINSDINNLTKFLYCLTF